MIPALIFLLTALFFVGCSSSDVAGGTSIDQGIVALGEWKIEGVSQKGPFITGSTVSVLELGGNSLLQTGKVFKSSIKSDKGDFAVSGTALASQYALLEVNGYYRNEVTGKKSSGPLTLNAITDLSNRENVNVNLLTHLEYERVKYLVSSGKSVTEAKAQAEREILTTMAMSESSGAFEDLDIFKSGEGNAKLLAISILLQGEEDVAGFTERLGKFSMELAQSGSWNDSATRTSIADWAYEMERLNDSNDDEPDEDDPNNSYISLWEDSSTHSFSGIRENILGWGISDSLPEFEKYTALFWADNYGLSKCSDSNKGDTAVNTNALSKRYGEYFVCDSTRWVSANKRISNYKGTFGTLIDERDGHTYKTVKIGEQVWMAENLNYDYQTEITRSLCYQDQEENCTKFGRLYPFAAAIDSAGLFSDGGLGCGSDASSDNCTLKDSARGVCPEGWHLPSKNEWEQLLTTVGGAVKAATVLRTADGIGTDDYGFNIIRTGDIENDYNDVYYWATSSKKSTYDFYPSFLIFHMYQDMIDPPHFQNNIYPYSANSVRCVMD